MESRRRYRLTVDEVYATSPIHAARVAPDGRQIAAIVQHVYPIESEQTWSAQSSEETTTDRYPTTVSNVSLLPIDGGPGQPLCSGRSAVGAASWSTTRSSSWQWRIALSHDGDEMLEVLQLGDPCGRVIFRGPLHRADLGLFEGTGDRDLVDPRWSPDGSSLLLTVREGDEIHLLDVAADGSGWRRRFTTRGTLLGCDWSPDGEQIVVTACPPDATTADVVVIDLANDQARRISTEQDVLYLNPVARWSPRGYLVLRSNRSGWAKLWAVDPETGATRPLTDGPWDEGAFRVGADGRIVFASGRDQPGLGTDLWVLDPDDGGEAVRLTRHPGLNTPLDWAEDGRVVFWHTSATELGDIWVAGANGEHPNQLTFTTPATLAAKLSPPRSVTISGQTGPITGLLHLPVYAQRGERYPGIVWIHGGPTLAARPGWDLTTGICSWLANEGFAVLNVNYRGSSSGGVAHMKAVAGDGLGKHDLADIVAAAAFLEGQPEVDTARGIGVGGHSWGGYLTLMAMTNHPAVFACGVASAGISDWAIQQAETEVRFYDHWLLGGWVYQRPELVADRSPITRVNDLAAPLLVTHGAADRDVPTRQIEEFCGAARAAKKVVTAHVYPQEGHILQARRHRQHNLEDIGRFFRRWLHPWDFTDNPSGDQASL